MMASEEVPSFKLIETLFMICGHTLIPSSSRRRILTFLFLLICFARICAHAYLEINASVLILRGNPLANPDDREASENATSSHQGSDGFLNNETSSSAPESEAISTNASVIESSTRQSVQETSSDNQTEATDADGNGNQGENAKSGETKLTLQDVADMSFSVFCIVFHVTMLRKSSHVSRFL